MEGWWPTKTKDFGYGCEKCGRLGCGPFKLAGDVWCQICFPCARLWDTLIRRHPFWEELRIHEAQKLAFEIANHGHRECLDEIRSEAVSLSWSGRQIVEKLMAVALAWLADKIEEEKRTEADTEAKASKGAKQS